MAYIDVSGLAGITLLAGIDPVTRDLFLSVNTVDASINPIDIYKEMRICRRLNESLRPYNVFMVAFGNISKGGGKYTERYVQLLEGTRIVPYDISHELTVTGVVITDDGQEGIACFDRSGLTISTVVDINYVPPQVEVVRAEAELDALLKASYNNVVIVDAANGESGTGQNVNGDYLGTAVAPSNNIADAKTIAINLGITILAFRGNYTFQAADNVDGWQLKGQGLGKTTFTFNSGCSTVQTVLKQATLTGVANGTLTIDKSELIDLSGVGGADTDMLWTDCAFDGTITLNSSNTVELHIVNGRSSIAGNGTPVLNINGSNTDIDNRGYIGGMEYTNNTAANAVSIDMLSGHVNIDSTIVNGTWIIRGQGKLTDDSTGTANINSDHFVQANVLQDGIERSSFIGKEGIGAAVKPSTGVDGTEWPLGTRKDPCKTVTNVHDICENNGFRNIYCLESININETLNDGYTFFGDNPQLVNINMDTLSSVNGCKFQDAYVTGKLTSSNIIWECILGSITGANGFIYKTALIGPIVLGTGTSTSINKCWVAPTAVNAQVTIDFDNQVSSCFISQFEQGKVLVTNMVAGSVLHIAGTGGQVIIDATCTGGTVAHGGAIKAVNNGTPDVYMNSATSNQVWSEEDGIDVHASIANKRVFDDINDTETIYEDDQITPRKVFDVVEQNGIIKEITPQ